MDPCTTTYKGPCVNPTHLLAHASDRAMQCRAAFHVPRNLPAVGDLHSQLLNVTEIGISV